MLERLRVGAVIGVLTGCAATPVRSPPPAGVQASPDAASAPRARAVPGQRGLPEVDGEVVQVSAEVEALRRGEKEPRTLASREVLHQGDRIAVQVTVDRPSYVYLAQRAPDAPARALFPLRAEQVVEPGGPLRLPPTGQWLEVTGSVQEENLYVVASTRPLGQTDPELCERLGLCGAAVPLDDRGKQPPPKPAEKPEPPPPIAEPNKREILVTLTVDGGTARGRTNHRGLAVLRFRLRRGP